MTEDKMPENILLPCPFCGSDQVGSNRDKMDDIEETRIICYNCRAEGAWKGSIYHTHAERVKAWNTRALTSTVTAQLAAAENLYTQLNILAEYHGVGTCPNYAEMNEALQAYDNARVE